MANGLPYNSSYKWNDIMGGSTGDGKWHLYEYFVQTDTNGSNGLGKIWVDGKLVLDRNDLNWHSGVWQDFLLGSNQETPTNGKDSYTDYDDVLVTGGTLPTIPGAGRTSERPRHTVIELPATRPLRRARQQHAGRPFRPTTEYPEERHGPISRRIETPAVSSQDRFQRDGSCRRLTVIGRSVFSRRVRHGIPNTELSSCSPPESVKTTAPATSDNVSSRLRSEAEDFADRDEPTARIEPAGGRDGSRG